MVVNFSVTLKNLSGEPLKAPEGIGGEFLTLKSAAIEALLAQRDGQTGEQKFKNYQLASKISSSDESDITPEEASTIKEAIGFCWSTGVVGAAWAILNG